MSKWRWLMVLGVLTPALVQAQTLEQRIERLEQITSNPVTIQLGQRLDFQASEIAQMQDRLDRLIYQNQQLQAEIERYMRQSSERIAQLEARISGSSIVPSQALDSEKTAIQTGLSVDQANAIQQGYDEAFSHLSAGDYLEAQQAFEAFVAAYPNSNQAPNAWYWLGESWLVQQNFEQALASFSQLINQFAEHERAENALLRAGDSWVGLKDFAQAKRYYQRLLDTYPDGRAAKTAQERLQRLEGLNE